MSGVTPVTFAPARIEATVVYLNAPRQIELRQEFLQPDQLGAAQILCETLVTAISPGTELAAYAGLPPLRAGVGYPRLQGYCNVARVMAVGSNVSSVRSGDRILSFISHRSHFVISCEDVLLKVAQGVRSEDVACTYLYHLGYNAVLRSGVTTGRRVLVIGLGVLGLTSVAMASLAGAKVLALSEHEVSRQLATQFGAAAVFSRKHGAALRTALTDRLADVVITTSSSWDDWAIALQSAGRFATIACLGFPGRGQPPCSFNPLDSEHFYARQLRIESVGMSPEATDTRALSAGNESDNLRYLAGLIAAGRIEPAKLVSATYEGVQIDRAYRDLSSRSDSPITYVLRWNRE